MTPPVRLLLSATPTRSCIRAAPPRRRAARSRCYSGHALPPSYDIEVPCRSSGSITLNVFPPRSAAVSPSARRPPTPLILFLPTNPLHPAAATADARILSALHTGAPTAALVRINYRIGARHRHPTPLHDVLTGHDAALTTVLPSLRLSSDDARESAGSRPVTPCVAVCGQLLGGGLAAALALTECGLGTPQRVRAAALASPVVDWPALLEGTAIYSSDVSTSKSGLVTRDGDDAEVLPEMMRERDKTRAYEGGTISPSAPLTTLPFPRVLFRNPDATLDPFASPTLFFRTPHLNLPSSSPYSMSSSASSSSSSSSTSDESEDIDPTDPLPRRKSPRLYPPHLSALSLPPFHVTLGTSASASRLHVQGTEFARLVRRSIARRWTREPAGTMEGLGEEERESKASALAERWATVLEGNDDGLWGVQSTQEHMNVDRSLEMMVRWVKGQVEKERS